MTRKVKWSLNPNGNDWAKDEERIGFKLLTKMGWKNGKGLGKNEDGNTDHVKVSMKDDRKGVGFVGPGDDWISHQDDFNSLLLSLNGHFQNKETVTSEKPECDTKNKRLQISKFRNSYKKFFKGKDMSNYSSDDIDAIFGNKKKRVNKTTRERLQQLLNDDLHENNSSSLNTCTSKKSMQEYFLEKMGKLKATDKKTDANMNLKDNTNETSTSDMDCESKIVDSQLNVSHTSSREEENLNEADAQVSEETTKICSSLSDTDSREKNENLCNEDKTTPTKCKKKGKNEPCNATENIKKGKKRKVSVQFEQECSKDSSEVTETEANVADPNSNKNNILKKKSKKLKKESIIEPSNSNTEFDDDVCIRHKAFNDMRTFADTFPNGKTLLIMKKFENLHKNLNESVIGTSNLFSVAGYGNVESFV